MANNRDRDPITNPQPSGTGALPRGDLLNGRPMTRNLGEGGPNYSPQRSSRINGAPPPNNPYR